MRLRYSAGVGFATVQHLAQRGARVYMGARSEVKAQAAIDRLKESGMGSGEVHHLLLDLSDVNAAEASAKSFLEKEDRLDILSELGFVLFAAIVTTHPR